MQFYISTDYIMSEFHIFFAKIKYEHLVQFPYVQKIVKFSSNTVLTYVELHFKHILFYSFFQNMP